MCAMSGELTVDLSALVRNYKTLCGLSAPSCEIACVVKADSYGLGADKCAPALYQAGARSFFVATSAEGLALRNAIPADSDIYVLGGLSTDQKQAQLCQLNNVTPVLNSLSEVKQVCESGSGDPVALHFDTGMNRLGLRADEAELLYEKSSMLEKLDVRLIMSHFASSEEADNPDNKTQLARFNKIIECIKPLCPDARYAIANSGGLFLGADYHLDMLRAGLALYGGHPSSSLEVNPMEPVISLGVPVLQVKSAKKGEGAGYNSTYHFDEDTDLAIVSIGYADGLLRSLSNKGAFYWRGYALPIRGRISMDSVICDLASVPPEEYPALGDMVEVIGPNQSIDALAASADTISYEILTSLGARFKRTYKQSEK